MPVTMTNHRRSLVTMGAGPVMGPPFSGMNAAQRAPSHRQLTRRPMQAFLYNMVWLFARAHRYTRQGEWPEPGISFFWCFFCFQMQHDPRIPFVR